jgi:coenzyme F420-reducing hydrogenase delta subunit
MDCVWEAANPRRRGIKRGAAERELDLKGVEQRVIICGVVHDECEYLYGLIAISNRSQLMYLALQPVPLDAAPNDLRHVLAGMIADNLAEVDKKLL